MRPSPIDTVSGLSHFNPRGSGGPRPNGMPEQCAIGSAWRHGPKFGEGVGTSGKLLNYDLNADAMSNGTYVT